MKITGFVCSLLLLVTSCQRELGDGTEDDSVPPGTCQLSKIVYYDSSGNIEDTAGLTYTNGKITRVTAMTYAKDLMYTNDRVTRIIYYDQANAVSDYYDSVSYNSAGKIESLTFVAQVAGIPTPIGGYLISYNPDGTPAKLIDRRSEQDGTFTDTYEYVYTWTNQNVSSMTIRNLELSINEPPLSFTYDNNPNAFLGLPAEYIFADNILFGISGLQFGYLSPFVFSKNNITSINGAPVVYSKDANDNFSAITIGTHRPAGYEYKCE